MNNGLWQISIDVMYPDGKVWYAPFALVNNSYLARWLTEQLTIEPYTMFSNPEGEKIVWKRGGHSDGVMTAVMDRQSLPNSDIIVNGWHIQQPGANNDDFTMEYKTHSRPNLLLPKATENCTGLQGVTPDCKRKRDKDGNIVYE